MKPWKIIKNSFKALIHKGWRKLALFLSRFLNTKRGRVYLDIGQAGYAVRNRLIAGENDLKMEAGELDAGAGKR